MSHAPISIDEQKAWSSYIHQLCGVSLDPSKGYLIETRLIGLMRETRAVTWSDILAIVKRDTSKSLSRKVFCRNVAIYFNEQW